jgi:Xaa-Pro aminopeptidase
MNIPFDSDKLDLLLDKAGIDVLVVTSKHNIQYLLGGYRYFFFDRMDAIGQSRYLPVLVYPRSDPSKAAYLGNVMERFENDVAPFWTPEVQTGFWGTLDTIAAVTDYIRRIGASGKCIGVETGFLPADAYVALKASLGDARFQDARAPLDYLRAIKTPTELDYMREASERVVDSMLAVFASHGPGTPKRDLVAALCREEQERGLIFEYCLPTLGPSLNRSPVEDRTWEVGQPMSLDSGANYHGYIGDLCRMGLLGQPDAELDDLLGEVLVVQDAALDFVKNGARGGDIFLGAKEALTASPNRDIIHFVAHGVGLVSHEVPHLTDSGPVPYPATDAAAPLASGMVLSVETTMLHPRRGFIKLEDTVAVTPEGYEFFGGAGRGWNPGKV